MESAVSALGGLVFFGVAVAVLLLTYLLHPGTRRRFHGG